MRNPAMIGERIFLRPFEVDDAQLLAEAMHAESETFMGRGRRLESPMTVEQWMRTMYDETDEVCFAICLRQSDECIGLIAIDHIDLINRTAETGTRFHNPEYRGRGYGTEAKHLILEYAFHRLHLERVVSFVFEPNTRSVAALEKQGYQTAGRIKYDDVKDGVIRDMLVFDLTYDEWLAA
ncbi:MAG: N-acetyltransferase, partial [Sphaerobacteraceae bacterium]